MVYLSIPQAPPKVSYLNEDQVELLLYQTGTHQIHERIQESTPFKELILYTSHLYRSKKEDYVVFLIGAGPSVYRSNAIVGCGVGNITGTGFKVRYVYEDIRQHRWREKNNKPHHIYQQLVVECYGVEVHEGDFGFLLYHHLKYNKTIAILSDQPVAIPSFKVQPTQGNISSVVCTKILSRGVSWLPEFLRYQKTLGVDHVHLSILDTFIKDGGYRDILVNDSFFMKAIREKYITIHIWKEWYKSWEWFYFGNILMYLDCIYRYRGTYDFVSLWDTDDFFTVRVPGMSYKDFLVNYCYKEGIGSCSFRWLYYYPGVCGFRKDIGEDGNVTHSMVPHSPRHEQKKAYKSVHLSTAIQDSSFHDASCNSCLVEGYRPVLIPPHIAYMAHLRLNKNIPPSSVCYF